MKKIMLILLLLSSQSVMAGGGDYTINISPNTGPTAGGGILVISNILAASDIIRITVGGKICSGMFIQSSDTITCTIPSGTGQAPVILQDTTSVQAINGTSHIFNYNPPSIAFVSPTSINQFGGETISIGGQNFGSEPGSVFIGGEPCSVFFQNDNNVTCISPAGSGENLAINIVQSNGSSTTLNNAISYIPCPPGTFTDNGQCFPCAPGTYQPDVGQASCGICPAGSACPDPVTISLCSVGEFAPEGSTSCSACPFGQFADETGQSSCQACAAGTFSNAIGAAVCNECSQGTYSNTIGATSCVACELGRFQDQTGQTQCKSCSAGAISSITGANTCTACAEGTFSDIEGGIECNACQVGTFQNFTGQSSCKSCSPGTFADTEGAEACTLCSPGRYQNDIGQASCFSCDSGSFAAFSGSTECTLCPSGSFQSELGQTSCLSCPDSELQPAEGQTSCLGPGQCDALYGVFFSEFESSQELPNN